MIQQLMQFMKNPSQVLSQIGIPQQYLNNPNDAIQYLMNTGKINQQQYNWAVNQAQKIQNDPNFKNLFKQ